MNTITEEEIKSLISTTPLINVRCSINDEFGLFFYVREPKKDIEGNVIVQGSCLNINKNKVTEEVYVLLQDAVENNDKIKFSLGWNNYRKDKTIWAGCYFDERNITAFTITKEGKERFYTLEKSESLNIIAIDKFRIYID